MCAWYAVDVFRAALSSQPPLNQLQNRTLSIIDRPEVTLKQPFINQTFVREWSETIATATDEPSSRTNPLYATMAGKGKGKTRFFVELEKTLNERDEQDVFAVAIAFNSDFSYVEKFDKEDDAMSMAVEVVLRMLTMAYSVANFKAFRKEFTEALRSLQRHQRVNVNGVKLLRECVTFLVDDVRSSGRPCKKFVLLVDEPKKLVKKGISVHAFNVLRRALLDDEMRDTNNRSFRVSMAMATRYIDVLGVRDSGRPVVTVPLPIALDIDAVYRQWLPAHLPQLLNASLVDDSSEPQLKALLSLTACLPRTTAILVKVLEDEFSTDKPLSFTVTTTALVLKELMKQVEMCYFDAGAGANAMLDNAALVFSVLWRKHAKWNDVDRAMADSYLVNPPAWASTSMQPIPAMAALSLWRLKTYLTDEMTLLKPVVEATVPIVADAAAYHEPHTLGRQLGRMGNAFITCKLLSAERVSHGDYSLFALLGCQLGSPIIANYRDSDLKVTRSSKPLEDFYHPTQLPYSYDNINNHVAALSQCQLNKRDVLVVKGHEREGWDGLWVLRQTNGKPFVLVVDYQFREVLGDTPTATAGGQRGASIDQAERFRDKIVTACQEAFPSTSGYDGSAAAAIAAGDFAFVYVDTAPSDEAEGDVSRVFADDDDHFARCSCSRYSRYQRFDGSKGRHLPTFG